MREIPYQQNVLKDLVTYMGDVDSTYNLYTAWNQFWQRQNIRVGVGGVPAYNNTIPGVPYVCMKVPTAGGKTYIACSALARIFDRMPKSQPRFVVWLVPSDTILSQTYDALNDPAHDYRRKINLDFSGRVQVYNKDQLLNGQNFDPDSVMNQLSICVFSYASFRVKRQNADSRKVNQENGNLKRWADYFQDKSLLLADTPDTALIQVLRQLTPLVVVDESHNAGSELSVDMLTRLNPHFILALTATPLEGSNILSYVDARDLKRESMVKLPVTVYNRNDRNTVIRDAIQLQRFLETTAIKEREHSKLYVRPIVLFQAQPNIKGKENDTYNRIKTLLLEAGIPSEQIAIKTSQLDEIGKIDLLSEDCPIRYIITVNALKEGWDCPFAYILASLANKTSRVDVEQILGRILRQPYQTKLDVPLLNSSYVLTCSNDFRQVLDNIVVGLNKAGFSRRDYVIGGNSTTPENNNGTQMSMDDITMNPPSTVEPPSGDHDASGESNATDSGAAPGEQPTTDVNDDFSDIHADQIKEILNGGAASTGAAQDLSAMVSVAQQRNQDYERESQQDDHGYEGGEKGEMKNQIEIDPLFRDEVLSLRIPLFYYTSRPNLFGDGKIRLQKEHLSKGFSLINADSKVSFDFSTGDMYNIDLKETGEAVPQYKKAELTQLKAMKEILARIPSEKRLEACIQNICGIINKNDRYKTSEVSDYVRRIIGQMTEDELAAIEISQFSYAATIRKKIAKLEEEHREEQFHIWCDSGKLTGVPCYAFPQIITPLDTIDSIPKSLYTAEKNDMNGFERRVLDMIVALPNVKWWHRIIENDKKEFKINGFIDYTPDFVVSFQSGIVAVIEVKGDFLANDDSQKRLELGARWQSAAGDKYRYFMVFKDKALQGKGSYTLDKAIEVLREL